MYRYSFIWRLAAICGLLVLASCATLNRPSKLVIDGLIFQNLTTTTIQHVQVHVKKTSAFAECSPVLANNACTTTFKPFPYQGNAISISWEQDSRTHKTGEFHATLPDQIIPGKLTKLLVVINRDGSAGAKLVQ